VGALAAIVLALTVPSPVATLRDGQREWFMPGRLQVGDAVVCVTHGRRLTMKVAARGADSVWTWNGTSAQGSVTLRQNGAAEVDCGVGEAPPRVPTSSRYLVSRHGLGLLRGTNTRARLQQLYGPGTSVGCTVAWPSLGLRATFAGCSPQARLTDATVTGSEWSTLDGVRVGDPVARMVWQDAGATRVGGTWILGGVGLQRPPRLVALVADGRVRGFRIATH